MIYTNLQFYLHNPEQPPTKHRHFSIFHRRAKCFIIIFFFLESQNLTEYKILSNYYSNISASLIIFFYGYYRRLAKQFRICPVLPVRLPHIYTFDVYLLLEFGNQNSGSYFCHIYFKHIWKTQTN